MVSVQCSSFAVPREDVDCSPQDLEKSDAEQERLVTPRTQSSSSSRRLRFLLPTGALLLCCALASVIVGAQTNEAIVSAAQSASASCNSAACVSRVDSLDITVLSKRTPDPTPTAEQSCDHTFGLGPCTCGPKACTTEEKCVDSQCKRVEWDKCADEGGTCECSGAVKMGQDAYWTAWLQVPGKVLCKSKDQGGRFDDIIYGSVKECRCETGLLPDKKGVVVTTKIDGLDFEKLQKNPKVKASLEKSIEESTAEEAGVSPGAVTATIQQSADRRLEVSSRSLLPRAVVAQIDVVLADDADPADVEAKFSGESALGQRIVDVVKSNPRLSDVKDPDSDIVVEPLVVRTIEPFDADGDKRFAAAAERAFQALMDAVGAYHEAYVEEIYEADGIVQDGADESKFDEAFPMVAKAAAALRPALEKAVVADMAAIGAREKTYDSVEVREADVEAAQKAFDAAVVAFTAAYEREAAANVTDDKEVADELERLKAEKYASELALQQAGMAAILARRSSSPEGVAAEAARQALVDALRQLHELYVAEITDLELSGEGEGRPPTALLDRMSLVVAKAVDGAVAARRAAIGAGVEMSPSVAELAAAENEMVNASARAWSAWQQAKQKADESPDDEKAAKDVVEKKAARDAADLAKMKAGYMLAVAEGATAGATSTTPEAAEDGKATTSQLVDDAKATAQEAASKEATTQHLGAASEAATQRPTAGTEATTQQPEEAVA